MNGTVRVYPDFLGRILLSDGSGKLKNQSHTKYQKTAVETAVKSDIRRKSQRLLDKFDGNG